MNNRIALVYPYFRTKARHELLFQPLGIALLSSCIKLMNLDVRQFDCTFSSLESVKASIREYSPAIVGIYIMATMSSNAQRLLSELRPFLPQTLFVAGGPLSSLYPWEFGKSYDAVFRGEADIGFPRFCRDYITSEQSPLKFKKWLNPNSYPGIFVFDEERVVSAPAAQRSEASLSDLPIPDRETGEIERYQEASLAKTGKKTATIMTTFGCPFSCDFCSKPVFGNQFRKKPAFKVFEEIRNIKSLGYDSLWIADDCFTLDTDHMRKICMAFINTDINMQWSCLSRVDKVDPESAFLMRNAGCNRVYLGLESGSDETLRLMNKRTTVRQGLETARIFSEAGIKTTGFFIVGYPGETMISIEKTLRFALTCELDEISFSVPYPLPGSSLYMRLGLTDRPSDWEMENEVKFLYKSDFDPRLIKAMIDDTMAQFEKAKGRIPDPVLTIDGSNR
jgi:anaerobic magnesium-protoporphyrin IX monomethyl ester cyclase